VIPRRFRPVVVLCVGDEGRAIGAQLSVLLASEMDAARRACVALLSVDAASDGTLTGGWLDSGASPAHTPHPLPRAVVEALRGEAPTLRTHERRTGVLDDYAIARVRDDGYAVPKASVVVWIATAAPFPWLASAAGAVAEALRVERVEGWTLLALSNVYPRDPAAHRERERRCAEQPWEELLVGGTGPSGAKPLASFAYLFESHDERDTFWEGPDDVPFAAAEAIFVLAASGITTTREYDETLRRSLPAMVKEPYERIGSIGTSRLTFPRAQAEQYCAGTLGAAVLREWAREERQVATPEESEERRRAAMEVVTRLRRATGDSQTYLRGGRPSPRLSAEGVAQARGLKRPDPDGGYVFAHLRRDTVEDLVTRRRDIPAVLRMQADRSEAGIAQWQKAIRAPWQRYSAEVERSLVAELNQLLLRGPAGVTSARVYAEHVHHLLALEKERLYRQQERREAAYERFLRATDAVCDGPWLDDMPRAQTLAEPAQVNILDAPTIISNGSPSGIAPAGAAANPASHTLGDGDEDEPESPAPRAVRTRDEILDTLAYRYRWRKRHKPEHATVVGAALMVTTPAVFLARGFLPAEWFAGGPLPLLLIIVAAALVAGLAAWGYLTWRANELDEAVEDLRRIYRRELSHRCERYEFQQRLALLTGLQNAARRMLERLIAWERFAEDMAGEMEREASCVERELFDGATGRRDVLVANRQRLRPYGYTLKHFAEDVRLRRETAATGGQAGAQEWHRSPAGILPHLREHLRQGATILDAEPDNLTDPVRDFCLAIVRPYLTGDLVSIGAALDVLPADNALDLLDTLRDRAVILYRPLDPPRPPITFVAARDEYRRAIAERDQSADAVLLTIDDVEWLATLRLLPGGAVPSFWQRGVPDASRLIVPAVPTWTQEPRPTGSD
jgi:hypothetical protein